ncbi:MAG: hypothetical protein KKB59_10455 [Spirochaetes bacterium]|nr:hypothetical protein [Spirochaetota bacterium]
MARIKFENLKSIDQLQYVSSRQLRKQLKRPDLPDDACFGDPIGKNQIRAVLASRASASSSNRKWFIGTIIAMAAAVGAFLVFFGK